MYKRQIQKVSAWKAGRKAAKDAAKAERAKAKKLAQTQAPAQATKAADIEAIEQKAAAPTAAAPESDAELVAVLTAAVAACMGTSTPVSYTHLDQSIYAWRGADIRNILDFEKDYRDTKVIKLEQNYRSHEKILRVANAVISKAAERKDKTVWSAEKEGEKPFLFNAGSDFQEAEFVVREIRRLVDEGRQYSDMAVL